MSQNRYLQFSTRTVFCSYETMNFQVPNFETSANKKSRRYDVIQKDPVHWNTVEVKFSACQNCASGQIAVIPKPELRWCWGGHFPLHSTTFVGDFWGTARDEFCHLGPSKKRFQPIFLPKKVAMPSKKLEVRAEALSLAQWFMVL